MKPMFGTKVWHSRQWQLSPDQDLILFLNSVRDVESLKNCGLINSFYQNFLINYLVSELSTIL